jgi:hypothetical protein
VAAASQENAATNAAWGTDNYTVTGRQGTFVETAGSGKLEFTDASDSTLFSLVPQPEIPAAIFTIGNLPIICYFFKLLRIYPKW